ncbi:MAG: nucleotidyltransferase family protein [Bacillota bacterium]
MVDAVVLAGGGKKEPLTEREGVSNKAFIAIKGKPLLGYVLEALNKAPSIGKTVVVGPERELLKLREDGYVFDLVPESGSMLDNLAAALEIMPRDRVALVVTGDIPLLKPGGVEEYLSLCAPLDQDFYYPVLRRKAFAENFPETERTYVRLKEGLVTGGNLALLRPGWFLNNRKRLEMFISYRKKPLKLIKILPGNLIIKYLCKKLSVSDLERFLSNLLNLKARAVICELAELGIDVDKVKDLELVKGVLGD